jgi:Ser/Thr protein kinase RdoA (MazF antagonist)
MQVLSPYGKDVDRELRTVYGFASPLTLADFIVGHLRAAYGLQAVTIETLHIAYGLTALLVAEGEPLVLKFASRSMHGRPEQLFPWLAFARGQGIPVPEVLPTGDGASFCSPLATSDYEVVYLMRRLPGAPMQAPRPATVQRYAATMARFHEIGNHYPHPVLGSLATWTSKWQQRERLRRDLEGAAEIDQALLTRALGLIERSLPQPLSTSVLHGDFRLCHVLFAEGELSGLIDVDQSTSGERWVDLCYGLLSGSAPEDGSLLDRDLVQLALRTYHQTLPLTDADLTMLPVCFTYAMLETLRDLLPSVRAGTAAQDELVRTQLLGAAILDTPVATLLASAA